jgi:hypothetical protein
MAASTTDGELNILDPISYDRTVTTSIFDHLKKWYKISENKVNEVVRPEISKRNA